MDWDWMGWRSYEMIMGWDGMGLNGMEIIWDDNGMEWDGMEWRSYEIIMGRDGMGCRSYDLHSIPSHPILSYYYLIWSPSHPIPSHSIPLLSHMISIPSHSIPLSVLLFLMICSFLRINYWNIDIEETICNFINLCNLLKKFFFDNLFGIDNIAENIPKNVPELKTLSSEYDLVVFDLDDTLVSISL